MYSTFCGPFSPFREKNIVFFDVWKLKKEKQDAPVHQQRQHTWKIYTQGKLFDQPRLLLQTSAWKKWSFRETCVQAIWSHELLEGGFWMSWSGGWSRTNVLAKDCSSILISTLFADHCACTICHSFQLLRFSPWNRMETKICSSLHS